MNLIKLILVAIISWLKAFYSPESVNLDIKRKIAELEVKRAKVTEERKKVCGERGADVRCFELVNDEHRLSADIAALNKRLT